MSVPTYKCFIFFMIAFPFSIVITSFIIFYQIRSLRRCPPRLLDYIRTRQRLSFRYNFSTPWALWLEECFLFNNFFYLVHCVSVIFLFFNVNSSLWVVNRYFIYICFILLPIMNKVWHYPGNICLWAVPQWM